MPEGTSLYVRRISSRRHGSPKEFAKRCRDHGLSWIALAAIWQEAGSTRRMNSPETFLRYAEALEAVGIETWAWGYPWQGAEERFRDRMMSYVVDATRPRILLDPELGANPERAPRGVGKLKANNHAEKLVEMFAGAMGEGVGQLGLSTFGNGWRIGWFPLLAFTKALVHHFGGRTFIGGQTYTDDGVIDRSIADMQKVILKAGGQVMAPNMVQRAPSNGVEVVPNFGTYRWDTPTGRRAKGAKAKPKSALELRGHLYEFIDEGEPVDALVGWAENFMTRALWDELARFADMMERGACRLPKRS